MSPDRHPAQPPELPGYSYRSVLGSGGFADVFLYERALPRMQVAIKVLVGTDLSDEARNRFTDEANTMARFQSHPYIVPIFGADISSDGRPYIVMQYYPNDNLAVRARRQTLSTTDAIRIGIQISSAVETAHRAGILHRDIKPANILTSEFGDPGLTDFGIAGASAGRSEGESGGLSIPWSPPEAFESAMSLDERCDVYSLGATVFHLLAGRSPFEISGETSSALVLMERIERSPIPSTGRPDVPLQLERVLARSLSKNPNARQPSALQFARDLQAVEQDLHLKTTTIVLPSESSDDPPHEVDLGVDRTRGRIALKVDPYADPHPTSHRNQRQAEIADIPKWKSAVSTEPAPDAARADAYLQSAAHSELKESAPTRSRPRVSGQPENLGEPDFSHSRRGTYIGIGIIVIVGVVIGIVVSLGGSPQKGHDAATGIPTTAPIIVPPVPPAPTGVMATRNGATVTVTWTNPDPMRGDYYVVAELLNGRQISHTEVNSGTATEFTGVSATDDPCFTVVLQRARGGDPSSHSKRGCTNG